MPGRNPDLHHIEVPRTARFWTLEPTEGVPKGTLYALHGYGQLAEFFIRKFQPVADTGWRVVAPEGGHRFYLEGFSGRVGASWMTKEDRLSDIADYVRYLDLLRAERQTTDPEPHVLLGFSQGVATALRWLIMGSAGPESWHGIVAHSGVIPPDLPQAGKGLSKAVPLHLIAGRNDAFIDNMEHRFDSAEQEWVRLGGKTEDCRRHTFEGGHEVDVPSLIAVLQDMLRPEDSTNLAP